MCAVQSVENKSLDRPCRPLSGHATVEYIDPLSSLPKAPYDLIDNAVKTAGIGQPVYFDKSVNLLKPCDARRLQRHRFWQGLCLSMLGFDRAHSHADHA